MWTPDDAAVALVQAVRGDDLEGTRAILRHCDRGAVAVLLAKLMAEACDDWEVSPGWWRT